MRLTRWPTPETALARRLTPGPACTMPAHAALLLAILTTGGCYGPPALLSPRNVVLESGQRIRADPARLLEVHDWLFTELETVPCLVTEAEDPTEGDFWPCPYLGSPLAAGVDPHREPLSPDIDSPVRLQVILADQDTYPWEALALVGDTARVRMHRSHPDLQAAYTAYAYLRLQRERGRLGTVLPEAAETDSYGFERMIVRLVADIWLMGRASYQVDPHPPLDDLMAAAEAGYLDAFLFTVRPADFPEAREAWKRDNPGGLEAYAEWFRDARRREPPGPTEGSR